MSDTERVDQGLVGLLVADATLQGLAPGGVFWELAPQGVSTPFVIVLQEDHEDQAEFGGEAFEKVTYGVQVMVPATSGAVSGTNVDSAASRIKALLHHQTFSATGYTIQLVQRIRRVKEIESDGSDRLWQIRGGIYEVWAAPA